jgi:PAT family beta-lactamase induction signal transducer AmpG
VRRASALQSVAVYLDRRVLVVLVLGFSSGLPLALSGSTLAIWMAERGVSLADIGLYALVGLPYTIKFAWAPLVDAARIPVLTRRLGRRRGWMVLTQLLLIASIAYLGLLDPLASPWLVALGAVSVATVSATQDVVIDAFRVESLDDDQQAAGMACFVAAYRVAMLVSGAGVIGLVALLELRGVALGAVWAWGYAAMAALVLVGVAAVLAAREPAAPDVAPAPSRHLARRFAATAWAAFADFFAKPGAIAILAFVVLFKFCDAFAGVMTGPFVIDIGFDKTAYAAIVKGVGFAALIAGGFAGGIVARALPLPAALWCAGIVQMLSNFMFAWQAHMGVSHGALTATIVVENFTGALGTVIFVGYLSGLCSERAHTATQFALLTALAATGRTALSAGSGFVAEQVGWIEFFVLSALMAVPALALLAWLQARGQLGGKAAPIAIAKRHGDG